MLKEKNYGIAPVIKKKDITSDSDFSVKKLRVEIEGQMNFDDLNIKDELQETILRKKQLNRIDEVLGSMSDNGDKRHLFFLLANKTIIESSGQEFFRGTLGQDVLVVTEKNHFKLIPFNPDEDITVYFYSIRNGEHKTKIIPHDAEIKTKGVVPKIDLTKIHFESEAVFSAYVDSLR